MGNGDSGVRRVLIVAKMFPHPEEPGVGPFVHEQALALRRRGLDVRVISGRAFPMYLRRPFGVVGRWRHFRHAWTRLAWDDWDGVPVLYVPHHVGRFASLLGQDDPYRDAVLRGMAWARPWFDFDLIHAHSSHPDGYAALALAQRYRRPFVITEHTGPFSSLTSTPALRRKTLAALAAARRAWCVSHALTQEVRSYFPPDQQGHIRTLFNGMDSTRFHPPARWTPDPAAPRFLFVGFLVEGKNVPTLIDAFRRVRQRLPGARLDIAGSGPLRGAIEQQIAAHGLGEAVRLHGQRSRAEVAALMRDACDILVLPSQSETFGVVLIEALASGKPVVASRCGGPESIVTDPSLGAMCLPNDVQDLARCLLETAARLPEFDPAAIRAHAVRTFEYRILADALVQQYQEIAADVTPGGRVVA